MSLMTLDLIDCDELHQFLTDMTQMKKDYPQYSHEDRLEVPTGQKAWYRNDSIFLNMVDIQRQWYSTYSRDTFQIDLCADLELTQNEDFIDLFENNKLNYRQEVLFQIVASRQERWELLCDAAGCEETPDHFIAYRGVQSDSVARAIVDSWLAKNSRVSVPHRGLSSWSLLQSGAMHYCKAAGRVGALIVTEISFEKTLLDVLVDNGYFAHHGLKEAEIVIGTGGPSMEISAIADRCKILVDRREYDCTQAKQADQALVERGI